MSGAAARTLIATPSVFGAKAMASTGRRDDRSAEAEAWRKLYKTGKWQAIRKAQLSAHPLCRTCLKSGKTTAATVCNHIDKDAKRTDAGFYAGPFSSECATCHDVVIGRDERRADDGRLPTQAFGADGWPIG